MVGRTYWAEQLDEDPAPAAEARRGATRDGGAIELPGIEWSHVRDLVAPIDLRSLDHPVGARS